MLSVFSKVRHTPAIDIFPSIMIPHEEKLGNFVKAFVSVLLWNHEKPHKHAKCFLVEMHYFKKQNSLGVKFTFASLNISIY